MRGNQHHPQLVGDEHHRRWDSASQLAEPLGMPWVPVSGQLKGLLLSRSSDDRVYSASECEGNCFFYLKAYRMAGFGR